MNKWSEIQKTTTINATKFLEILRFCLNDNNYFLYNDKIYNQVFGMPMGNPLSPTIADVVLDNLLVNSITELKTKNITIKYIAKYVDDILAIVKIDDKDEILKTLNSQHPKIKFTMETEDNGTITYLDTILKRNGEKIMFDWYSKETSSGRLMNYNATQPKKQIINTAINFIERVLKISDESFHATNIKKIYNILINNSFPKETIKTLIDSTKSRIVFNNTSGNTENKTEKHFYSVQYIPGLTDQKKIKPAIINSNNISFAYKPNLTLNTIFTNIKAPIKKEQQSNVVYEISCKGKDEHQCDLIYIGTTKRTLLTRMGEHKMDINKGKETTALSQHIIKTGHTPDFENVKIIDKETNERKRYTKESLHIQKKISHTMNLKEDTNNINTNYFDAIK